MTQMQASKTVFSSTLKGNARLVYLCLAQFTNKESICYPARKTIADTCGLSLSTVKRAIAALIQQGYIKREARYRDNNSQTSNLYQLHTEPEATIQEQTPVEAIEETKDGYQNEQLIMEPPLEVCGKAPELLSSIAIHDSDTMPAPSVPAHRNTLRMKLRQLIQKFTIGKYPVPICTVQRSSYQRNTISPSSLYFSSNSQLQRSFFSADPPPGSY